MATRRSHCRGMSAAQMAGVAEGGWCCKENFLGRTLVHAMGVRGALVMATRAENS